MSRHDAAYFTDSRQPVIYRVARDRGGAPGTTVETIPLSGDFQFLPGAFNLNGIHAAPDGKRLIVVHSALGLLYNVDARSGRATRDRPGRRDAANGDGILLDGQTLYVVQNRLNRIAVVRLAPDLLSGDVVGRITDPDFRVPTTIDDSRGSLYAVNARFGTPATPDTEYEIVQVRRR